MEIRLSRRNHYTSFGWNWTITAGAALILFNGYTSNLPSSETQATDMPYADWSWVPMGKIAFADSVLAYDPGALGENTGDEPAEEYRNTQNVLGPPDQDSASVHFMSLGNGGTLILQFQDNVLFDGEGPDLYFWMPDNPPEEAVVFISRDNQTFKRAGTVSSASPTLDIRQAAEPGVFYPIIKIRDNVFQGELDTPDLGADIDAVCAIHTSKFYEFSADQLFEGLSMNIRQDAGKKLHAVIQDIESHQNVQVLIEIYSDTKGAPDFNLLLSQQWAGTLRDFFREDLYLEAQYIAVGMASHPSQTPHQPGKTFINGRIQILIQYTD